MRIILIWIFNALALLAVAYLLPAIHVNGFISALIAALLLGLINTLLRPLLILLTLPQSPCYRLACLSWSSTGCYSGLPVQCCKASKSMASGLA